MPMDEIEFRGVSKRDRQLMNLMVSTVIIALALITFHFFFAEVSFSVLEK